MGGLTGGSRKLLNMARLSLPRKRAWEWAVVSIHSIYAVHCRKDSDSITRSSKIYGEQATQIWNEAQASLKVIRMNNPTPEEVETQRVNTLYTGNTKYGKMRQLE